MSFENDKLIGVSFITNKRIEREIAYSKWLTERMKKGIFKGNAKHCFDCEIYDKGLGEK